MTSNESEVALPPSVVLLKWLVIGLTASMIGGVIAIVWLLVTRLPNPNAQPVLPDGLILPEGVTPRAVTFGTGWILPRIIPVEQQSGCCGTRIGVMAAELNRPNQTCSKLC